MIDVASCPFVIIRAFRSPKTVQLLVIFIGGGLVENSTNCVSRSLSRALIVELI